MRFGLIGAGAIGAIRATALARSEKCQLAAVFDLDAARAVAVAGSATVHTTLESLLAANDVDAVVVSTPPNTHEDFAIRAVSAGKHVVIEKPMAPSAAACARIIAAARATGRVVTTGYNHRYFPAIKLVRDLVKSGSIGRLSHVRGYTGHSGLSEFKAPWMYDAAVMGGGALMDNGTHMIDLVRYIMGDADQISGMASSRVWQLAGVEDHAVVMLRSSDGVLGTVEASWNEWKGYRFHIEAYGDKGMARAHYAPMGATIILLDKPGGERRVTRHFFPRAIVREKLKGWQSTVIQTFEEEFSDFIALAEGQHGSLRIASAADGYRAVEIAQAVYESSVSGKVVNLVPLSSI